MSLSGQYRWIVSGTLVVNSTADLEAPIRFLGLEPFKRDGALFKRYLVRPIKAGDPTALAQVRALMKTISLRREKDTMTDFHLPPKNEKNILVNLSPKEQEAYDAISAAVKDFTSFVQASDSDAVVGIANNMQSILALITRLRQACQDLTLVPVEALVKILASTGSKGEKDALTEEEKDALTKKLFKLFANAGASTSQDSEINGDKAEDCAVCFDPLLEESAVIFRRCRHALCKICVEGVFSTGNLSRGVVKCPLCRADVSKSECMTIADLRSIVTVQTSEPESSRDADIGAGVKVHSSKTLAVLAALELTHAAGEKAVIFSSFVSYLGILQDAVKNAGYKSCRIDGRKTQKQRAVEIRLFTDDPTVSVMFCSVKACGVGITLTAANNIFLTDLWWAPAIDLQGRARHILS
jgi:SWI/SNF-related matrix-associated actin-dependent regulator of chromatin subfamily A3